METLACCERWWRIVLASLKKTLTDTRLNNETVNRHYPLSCQCWYFYAVNTALIPQVCLRPVGWQLSWCDTADGVWNRDCYDFRRSQYLLQTWRPLRVFAKWLRRRWTRRKIPPTLDFHQSESRLVLQRTRNPRLIGQSTGALEFVTIVPHSIGCERCQKRTLALKTEMSKSRVSPELL